CALWNSNPWVF
nr:immunoglobulin light chain junction region [Mus musculus]